MADILSVLGSPLIGSPIMATVQPADYNAEWSFHHIALKVYAALIFPEGSSEGMSDAEYTEFDFSTPVETKVNNGSTITLPHEFDISSALQAVADKYEYKVTPPNQYPYVKFYIEAWDDYIYAGSSGQTEIKRWPEKVDIYPSGVKQTKDTFCYAVQGVFTDYERMTCPNVYRSTGRMTRKPTTQLEVVYASQVDGVAVAVVETSSNLPSVSLYNVGDVAIVTNDEYPLYIVALNYNEEKQWISSSAKKGEKYQENGNENEIWVFNGSGWNKEDTVKIVRPNIFNRALITDYATDTDNDSIPDTLVEAIPDGPTSVVYPVVLSAGTTEGEVKTYGEGDNAFSVYATPMEDDVYEIRFINGLGCMESVHVKTLRAASFNPETEKHVMGKREKFNSLSRMMMRKSDAPEVWKMTSGPLDEAWQAWYAHEFLMSESMWIKVGTVWVPCNVSAEKVSLIDRSKAGTLEVEFELQLDLNGSALAAIAI